MKTHCTLYLALDMSFFFKKKKKSSRLLIPKRRKKKRDGIFKTIFSFFKNSSFKDSYFSNHIYLNQELLIVFYQSYIIFSVFKCTF